MKKTNVFGAIFIMVMVMFTSCLEGDNSRSGETVGVLRYDYKTSKYLLDTWGWGCLYSPTFNSTSIEVREGACYYFNLELDSDLPENSTAAVSEKGYYTVTTPWKHEVDRYSMLPVFLDTTTLLTKEIPLVEPSYAMDGYVKGILFIKHVIKQPEDQKYVWNLSYNAQNMVVEESGSRIYDVFLRATIDGSTGTKTPIDIAIANAYDMKYFFESAATVEKGQKKDVVNIRFNYISEIKDGKFVWKKTEKVPIPVDLILADVK